MSSIDEGNDIDLKIKDRLINEFLPPKFYHRHSDIDLFINITITQLLNYKTLLTDELNEYIHKNYGSNYNYFDDIKDQKEKLLKNIFSQKSKILENQSKYKDSILSYDFPEFEIYFIAKLFVDGMERKPECCTKLLFNSKNINQYISMRFKYKDLTIDSYILLELYSMQLPLDNNLLGTTKIYLFDNNLNLGQGRHIFRLNKTHFEKNNEINETNNENSNNEAINNNNDNNIDTNLKTKNNIEREDQLDGIGKEIDSLINSFYGKEFSKSNDYYGELKDSEKEYSEIRVADKFDNIKNNYYFNKDLQRPMVKLNRMNQFDSKLEELLRKTENSYVVIKFPSFKNTVIYEEAVSKNYKKVFKNSYRFDFGEDKSKKSDIEEEKLNPYFKYTTWVFDPCINKLKKDYTSTENPVENKFSILTRINDDELIARDIRLNPYNRAQINEVLNMPDFIELESKNSILFWSHRYELLKKNTPYALTKIMNSVKWGDVKSENEFIKNILNPWKTVEICDILYMLSRKFSVNKLYPNTNGVLDNFDGMKKIREYAIKKLSDHSNEELNFILLQLVQAIRYEDISLKKIDTSPLVKFLIQRCCKDIILSSSFFWFIECEADTSDQGPKTNEINETITKIYGLIRDKFFEDIKKYPENFNIINNEISFKEELVKISSILSKVSRVENKKKELHNLIDNDEKKFLQETEYFLPIDPRLKIKGTITESCTVFKSAKCPVKYTFKVTEDTKQYNHHDDKDHMRIMFKYGDDLRQDQLILQMINYMDSLLKNMHLDYEFTTYKTLATSKSDGFVEFVPNSKTIFDIKKEYNNQIRAYYEEISKKNGVKNEEELNKKLDSYINSCAGYCVVTYLLGIGDRHLENLMIDKNGKLFHIDFGYILGKDPKPMPPPIKLCKEMVECMGGKGSKRYEEFQQKCVNAYWVLRDNARVIVNMFYLMIDSGIPELNNIDNLKKLHEKFVPQKNKQEASNYILDNLRESVDAMMPVFMEKLHAWAQYWK